MMVSRYTPAARFWAKVDRSGDCWLWKGAKTTTGYGYFGIAGGIMERAHRVAWVLAHHQSIPAGVFLCHRCDNPLCVRPSHLFPGKARDNTGDMFAKGRGRSKIHPLDVLAMRRAYRRGRPYHPGNIPELAKKFGISEVQVGKIVGGRAWRII